MKFISPTLHGLLDYLMCGFLLTLPSVYSLSGGAATVCFGLAASYLIVSLCTNMPFGLVGWIPFWVHGGFELVSGLIFIASPWIFDFAHTAHNSPDFVLRNIFIGVGVVFLLVYAFTQWRPAAGVDTVAATA
ncbi:MAG: hypothetical protein EOO62_14015 [Hymenobacter sp.]|nr:MAG: hypothetical protein EOO62_14015 [Hymenobacter sp.]